HPGTFRPGRFRVVFAGDVRRKQEEKTGRTGAPIVKLAPPPSEVSFPWRRFRLFFAGNRGTCRGKFWWQTWILNTFPSQATESRNKPSGTSCRPGEILQDNANA